MYRRFKKSSVSSGIILIAALFTSNTFAGTLYKIDPTHSTVGFAVRHMQVGVVRGEFTDYYGEVQFDKENLDASSGIIVIKAQSINTRLEARDRHLRGADFFDVEHYPIITFESKKILKKGDSYEIMGNLTIREVTKEVSGIATILGPVRSPFGQEVIGVHGETIINRHDFGVSWNSVMPDGGFVVGDEVRIIIDIEADKKMEESTEKKPDTIPTR